MAKSKMPLDHEPWIVGAPTADHPVMSELARFHAGFAVIEASLGILLSFALNQDERVAHAILMRIRNIADRIEIVRAVSAEARHLSDDDREMISTACDKASSLNARRNLYAHGIYQHRGNQIRVTPYAFSGRKSQREILALPKVQADVEAIEELVALALVGTGQFTQEMLDADPSPRIVLWLTDPKAPRT